MIKIKLLGLLSFLLATSASEILKQATDKCIDGLHEGVQALLEEYYETVGAMTIKEKLEHFQKMHEAKADQRNKLEEYMKITRQERPANWPQKSRFSINAIMRLWNESTDIIELPGKMGHQFFGILVLVDSDPAAALKQLKEEFLTPENVASSLNQNGLRINNELLWDLSLETAQEELIKQFDEEIEQDPNFKEQIEDCAKRIIDKNPDLLEKFKVILTYCDRKLFFEGSRPVIFKDWGEVKELKNPGNLRVTPCAGGLAQLTENFLNGEAVHANLDLVRNYEKTLTFPQRLEYYRQISEESSHYISKLAYRQTGSPEARKLMSEWLQVCHPQGFLLHTILYHALYQPDEAFKELIDRLFSTPEETKAFLEKYKTKESISKHEAYIQITELLNSAVGVKVRNEFATRFADKRKDQDFKVKCEECFSTIKDQDHIAHDQIADYLLRNV